VGVEGNLIDPSHTTTGYLPNGKHAKSECVTFVVQDGGGVNRQCLNGKKNVRDGGVCWEEWCGE